MPGPSQRTKDFQTTIQADVAFVHHARARFDEWLVHSVDDAQTRGDLLVVLSELLTNGVEAAADPDAEVETRAAAVDGRLVIEVANPVAGSSREPVRWDLDDPLRRGGRGLPIVSALVDDVRVLHDARTDETVVRCTKLLTGS